MHPVSTTMAATSLHFGSGTSFDAQERATLEQLAVAIASSDHPAKDSLLETIDGHVQRVGEVAAALRSFPRVFSERTLGQRKRGLETLVDLLARADDARVEMFLPTQALVGRALLMAELNVWRLTIYICDELFGADGDHPLRKESDHWLHGCVYTKCAEELLQSIAMDSKMERDIRRKAVGYLVRFWETRHTYGVRHFFPLLAETWSARNRIRVSVGTLLGVSEIFRLLQVGCDPQFVEYFCRSRLSQDEQEAFQEFLIGVTTEQIHSLEELISETGKDSITPEEAEQALARNRSELASSNPGVRAYEFYRSRYLQAAARRLKNLPGPKRTAEEYVMIYFLDRDPGPKES